MSVGGHGGDGCAAAECDLAQRQLRCHHTPDLTLNLGANYEVGDFSFVVNYYYNDGWSATPDNRVNNDAYNLLSLSVNWLHRASGLNVSLWCKNLTDDHYFQQLGASNFSDNGVQGMPRMYGVTLGFEF